jgi:hypothetical protein
LVRSAEIAGRRSAEEGVVDRSAVNNPRAPILSVPDRSEIALTDLLTSPLRAGRHLAVWIVWHSVGVSLLPEEE